MNVPVTVSLQKAQVIVLVCGFGPLRFGLDAFQSKGADGIGTAQE